MNIAVVILGRKNIITHSNTVPSYLCQQSRYLGKGNNRFVFIIFSIWSLKTAIVSFTTAVLFPSIQPLNLQTAAATTPLNLARDKIWGQKVGYHNASHQICDSCWVCIIGKYQPGVIEPASINKRNIVPEHSLVSVGSKPSCWLWSTGRGGPRSCPQLFQPLAEEPVSLRATT